MVLKLQRIKINKYGTLKDEDFNSLKQLNIFIGPNNCGKTHILDAIAQLNKLDTSRRLWVPDPAKKTPREEKLFIKFSFDNGSEVSLDENNNSVDFPDEAKSEIDKKPILFYQEDRLKSYENVRVKKFPKEVLDSLKLIDPKLINALPPDRLVKETEEGEKLARARLLSKEGKQEFESKIDAQGSGIRSLIALLTEIYEKGKDIILIDEPELGLNPSAKQSFLKLLLELSKEKQFFIATHDPSFINPVLLKNYEDVSIRFYSPIKDDFIKVEDVYPSSFAGFMPHTTSLEKIHIYTEGFVDVNVFQGTLYNYLRLKDSEWYKTWNEVGIYHLGGDNWKNFLYTVVKPPYKSIVILDGNKEEKVEEEIDKLNKYGANKLFPKFGLCKSLNELEEALQRNNTCPIYCLQNEDIKEYFGGRDVDKKEAINAAWDSKELPEEFSELFDSIFSFGRVVFYDGFEEFTGWHDLTNDLVKGANGSVEWSSEHVYKGRHSLKKTTDGDPSGGYKELKEKVGLNILFSGWIYRPSDSRGGKGDRVAIEDENFNGYGLFVHHGKQTLLKIERRDEGRGGGDNVLKSVSCSTIKDRWYQFKFYLKEGGRFDICIYDESSREIGKIKDAEDENYNSFDRIVVHGGYEYYLDCLKVEYL